jgi:hypothetical protein
MLAKNPDAAFVPRDADDWLKERLQAIEACRAREDLDNLDIEYAVMLLGQAMGMSASTNKKVCRGKLSSALPLAFEILIASAFRGDALADHLLCQAAQRFIDNQKPLPKPLGDYVCKVLRGEGPRLRQGRHDVHTWQRDHQIVAAVRGLINCGCTQQRAYWAVSKALERLKRFMTEDAIKQVWRRHSQQYGVPSPPEYHAVDAEMVAIDIEKAQPSMRFLLSHWLQYGL